MFMRFAKPATHIAASYRIKSQSAFPSVTVSVDLRCGGCGYSFLARAQQQRRRHSGPPTQPECGIEVTFARSGVSTMWSSCESPLLELAEEHSVAIDFGCRAGSCGTSMTRLLSDAVRYLHQPNAPLEADEVLPCVAVPAEPFVLDA
jgi:ferredoxin